MSQPLSPLVSDPAGLLARLGEICEARDVLSWSRQLLALRKWLVAELAAIEEELDLVARGPLAIHRCGRDLLDLGGKRLRPLCVALAARFGGDFGERQRDFAVAVELVHNATLLHDDVVDLGETRRGAPTGRVIYGNAAAIFGGDWLLVDALKRISALRLPDLLSRTLETIETMIEAEAEQLARRGRFTANRDDYFAIIDGKTSALFRLALGGGAEVAGLEGQVPDRLEAYGSHLGLAFQLVDDLLDLTGDASETGKDGLADLREGHTTFPLLLAAERSPGLAGLLEEGAGRDGERRLSETEIRRILEKTQALEETRQLARDEIDRAIAELEDLPEGAERRALIAVAEAAIRRRR